VKPTGTLAGGYEANDVPEATDLLLRMETEEDLTYRPLLPSRLERMKLLEDRIPFPTAEALGIDASSSETMLLVIEPVVWRSEMKVKRETRDRLLFTTRERLFRHALRNYQHPVHVRFNVAPDDPLTRMHRTVRLRAAITDCRGGNGLARFLIGFGMGCAALQVEGELVEDGQRIGEFAVRSLHGGYAHWGSNVMVLSDAYCLRYAADAAAARLMDELPNHLPGARPRPADSRTARR
jgi:hypothetical protein